MQAGTPQPEPQPASSPTRSSEPSANDGKPDGIWRALGIALAVALAFACAVMIMVMADIGGTPRCDAPAAIAQEREETGTLEVQCFDGSQLQKTVSLLLGWPAGIIAGIAALVALFFAATGRRGELMLRLTGSAIVLGALSILIGSL
jgi:hypothetical protein